jgi:hypothetical protein
MVAGQRYYYEQRVSGLSDGSTFMQVAVRIMGAGSSGWATPQFLQRSSARERQRLQLSLTPQYEKQYITITGAVGGTFKLQFDQQLGVSALSESELVMSSAHSVTDTACDHAADGTDRVRRKREHVLAGAATAAACPVVLEHRRVSQLGGGRLHVDCDIQLLHDDATVPRDPCASVSDCCCCCWCCLLWVTAALHRHRRLVQADE